jgi:hypothetical protein
MNINNPNHPNNGGKFKTGDMVENTMNEWDEPGWIVASDEDEYGCFEIVNSRDDILEVCRENVSFVERY